ncbi:MAG: S41 family peptidase [Bacteroidota bacterium]
MIFLILVSVSLSAFGQILTSTEKRQILEEVSKVISENYVLQDSVPYIKAELKKSQQSEEFTKEYTKDSFAAYLMRLLRDITQDAHFAVLHNSSLYQTALLLQSGEGEVDAQSLSIGNQGLSDARKNFFFRKLEVMDGNVGYVKIEQMPSLEQAKETVDAAMRFLVHTDAMMIDLRGNRGGVGGFIPYLMSYFFEQEKKLLYTREYLAWDSVSYHYTQPDLPVKRYLSKPVYVLIDRFTGSAATNMAYTLSSFERAILLGENTGSGYRGAHSASIFPLGLDLVGLVPIGRVVNAQTGTNWREQGVDPDIACDAEDALSIAYKDILENLLDGSVDPAVKAEIEAILSDMQTSSQQQAEGMQEEDLSEYAGQYGETTISWENGKLYTKRPTVPIKLELEQRQGEVFKILLPPGAQGAVPDLRFNREDGVIVSVTTIRDGFEERTEVRE